MEKFFDAYGVRVRFSSLLILMGPAVIWTILFVDEIRNFTSLAFISVIIYAVSLLLVVPLRKKSNGVMKKIFYQLPTVTFLYEKNSEIDEKTRLRYRNKLQELSNINLTDSCKKDNYLSALEWLKSNYHKSERAHLVDEENMTFGLLCNLKGIKFWGITINAILLIITVLKYYLSDKTSIAIYIIVVVVSIIFIFLWVFVVTENNVKYAAGKYAKALLSCIDSL